MGDKFFRIWIFVFLSVFFPTRLVSAAQWEINPTATLSYLYSDNIDLSSNNKTGDAALSLNPSIQVTGRGSRLDLEGAYSLQVVRYRDSGYADDEFHSADINADFKISPDIFNIETGLRYGQQTISFSTAPAPENNIAITDNRTNSLTYRVKPVFHSRMGRNIAIVADYEYEGVRYDSDQVAQQHIKNSRTHIGISNISQGDFNWRVNYDKTRFDLSSTEDNIYSRSEVGLSYLIAPRFTLVANGGDETNDIVASQLGGGDTYWMAGFIWTPGPRTSVEITRGERFFGDSYSANITHRWKRSDLSINYDETITTTSAIQADTNLLPGFVVLSIVDEFVLQKALHFAFNARTTKTNIGFVVDNRELLYQVTLQEEKHNLYSMLFGWRFAPHSTFNLNATRQLSEFITTGTESELTSKTLSLEHDFGSRVSGNIQYTRYDNKTSLGLDDYESSFYGVNVMMSFR